MTKRKKITILIACGVIAITVGILGWMILIGKLNLRADPLGGYSVPKVINLQRIEASEQVFADVPTSHWAYLYIQAAVYNHLTYGCAGNSQENPAEGRDISTNYCPDMTGEMRQQEATFAVRQYTWSQYKRTGSFPPVCGEDIPCPQYFADVPDEYSYANMINTAQRYGLYNYVNGWSTAGAKPTNFNPRAAVNGEELWRVIQGTGGGWNPDSLTGNPRSVGIGTIINRAEMAGYFTRAFNLVAADPDRTKVLLEWDTEDSLYPESDQTVGFQIYRLSGSGYLIDEDLLWTIEPASLTGEGLEDNSSGGYFFDKTVEPGEDYTYFIFSFDSDGNCAFDDPERDTWQHACPPPATIDIEIDDVDDITTAGGNPIVNLIPNNSFEEGAGADANSFYENGTLWARTDEKFEDGKYSLKFTNSGGAVWKGSWFTPWVTLQPNTNYALSGYIYSSLTQGIASLDLNGNFGCKATATQKNTWQKVSCSFNSGSTTVVPVRTIAENAIGTAWYDNLVLRQSSP